MQNYTKSVFIVTDFHHLTSDAYACILSLNNISICLQIIIIIICLAVCESLSVQIIYYFLHTEIIFVLCD